MRAVTVRFRGQEVVFATWWLILWGVLAVALIAAAFLLPFKWWVVAAGIGFGVPEAIGLFAKHPELPPLTRVIHRFVPAVLSFPAMWGLWAGALWIWTGLSHPLTAGLMFAMLGFLCIHFVETYAQSTSKLGEKRLKMEKLTDKAAEVEQGEAA